jgi:hypothetical protein
MLYLLALFGVTLATGVHVKTNVIAHVLFKYVTSFCSPTDHNCFFTLHSDKIPSHHSAVQQITTASSLYIVIRYSPPITTARLALSLFT